MAPSSTITPAGIYEGNRQITNSSSNKRGAWSVELGANNIKTSCRDCRQEA